MESAFGHYEGFSGRGGQDHRTLRRIERPLFSHHVFRSRENLTEFASRGRTSLIWRARNMGLLSSEGNIKNQYVVSANQYKAYNKFAVVRNPWARTYSWYKNIMRDKLHQARLNIPADLSFSDFVRQYSGRRALRPQTYWLKDSSGQMPFDFIGKMESLEADFASMCEILGIDHVALPHKIAGDGSKYVDAYNEETKNLVARTCAEEIDLFKYSFGQQS